MVVRVRMRKAVRIQKNQDPIPPDHFRPMDCVQRIRAQIPVACIPERRRMSHLQNQRVPVFSIPAVQRMQNVSQRKMLNLVIRVQMPVNNAVQ